MKVHYINILLFTLPLNILVTLYHVNGQGHYSSTKHPISSTKSSKYHRSLCECEIYTSIYDNDPEMKKVMQDFDQQTSQRLREYDERLIKNRQNCKDQCDKDIQKIILKDKIEKELTKQLEALEVDITTEDIPACVCKKSVEDKVGKNCLKCGGILGGGIPGLGVLGAYAVNSMVQVAMDAAKKAAIAEGAEAGIAEGIKVAIQGVPKKFLLYTLNGKELQAVINANNFQNPSFFYGEIMAEYVSWKKSDMVNSYGLFSFIEESCENNPDKIMKFILANSNDIAKDAGKAATKMTTQTTEALTLKKTAEATSTSAIFSNPIVISFIVLVIIVLILLIIYLILRYRRKRKMKKKLQYLKLLKE
ncbi:surface antigen [Plasmodium falciparum UGT5.1]|uniref:Surface antigen n=1 Tax=Plasmodium falciparum UGT5.1 TaxID=1237627 RepID=W7JK97_PLAFA|nr:surface antigen [Plasmodium falciparum UGT5.1]